MGRKTLGALAAAAVWGAAAAHGAGFGIFEQGSKAMGMAGAFTAQADDGSAMFHNVAGLAFQRERRIEAGGTFIRNIDSQFTGAEPFPGEGQSGELSSLDAIVPHVYWVEPLGDAWTLGFGLNAPFGLTTEWEEPDQFSGRFLSTMATLRAVDLTPTIAFQLTPNFGVGFGALARFSDVELERRQAATNPFTLQAAEIAEVNLEGDFSEGFGWQVGFLNKIGSRASWGLSYRSKVDVDYTGDARLTQVASGSPVFDAILRTILPFDQDLRVETGLEFPDMASLGVAFKLTDNALVEVDANWTGWSSFETLRIDFVDGELDDEVAAQDYEDVYNYRIGLRLGGEKRQWRFGYVYDESPQPDESVGPLLPDADRNGFTVGYGHEGEKVGYDLALMYLSFDERTTEANRDNFNGTYETTAVLLGGTLSF